MADNAQSILRRLKDLYQNPRANLEQMVDQLNNFNKGRVAEIRPDSAGYRQLSQKERTEQMTKAALDNLGQGGMGALGVIKGKGGNWLRKELDRAIQPELRAQHLPELLKDPTVVAHLPQDAVAKAEAMDRWVKGPLQKYIMRDMATEGDPIRKLAEQGILHVDPQELNFNMSTYGKFMMPNQKLMAQSDMAKNWEGASDRSINQLQVKNTVPADLQENPWLAKLGPEEEVYAPYEPKNFMEDLALDRLHQHVYDALLEGRIRPEQLDSGSFGVEAAVRDAHNVRMAKQAAEEKAALEALKGEAVFEHKAYPEGYRWVEFKKPEKLPPRMGEVPPSLWGVSPEREALEKALSAEGDYMGHCVGDYCDDVLEGNTRVFSLRDPKGKSTVTVEARKGVPNLEPLDIYEKAPPELKAELYNRHGPESRLGFSESIWTDPKMRAYVAEAYPSNWKIQQIKGSGKKDPMQAILPEDLKIVQPYLKDFLNSQPWGEVKDMKNTGLRDLSDFSDYKGPRFLTPDEHLEATKNLKSDMRKAIDDPNFNEGWEPDDVIEFAEGGLVPPPHFEDLDRFLGR